MKNYNPDNLTAEGAATIICMRGKGGKGGGGGFVEADNTMRSSAIVRVIEVIAEGPIEGLAGGMQGIYINDTPYANADGSPNFGASATPQFRHGGVDNLEPMTGFNAVENEVSVGIPIAPQFANVVRTVSSPLVDAVMVTIQLPSGLSEQNIETGSLGGSEVTLMGSTRETGGTWVQYGLAVTIKGKTTSPYEVQYRIERPAAAGPGQYWEIQVTRISPIDGVNVKNATTWARMTEIQEVKITYDDAAIVGLSIDAKSVGFQIPKRGYLVKGLLLRVPHNLNLATRAYTGVFNGTLVQASVAFDNPVWALYDMMTNTRYGAAIPEAEIDIYSFYDASVYCDAPVSYTNRVGTTVSLPRFTFNVRIASRPQMFTLLKSIAGSMNANLIFWNGKWVLIQDRPTDPSKLISKANVLDPGFRYKTTGLFERHTAFNVSFNDRTDRHLERVVTVEDTAGVTRYGYNPIDIAAYGCTTEGQAIRVAKWALDTEMHQTEIVEFSMSMNGFDMAPGEVIAIYDEATTQTSGAGKVVSNTGTTVVLDRAVTLAADSTFNVLLADGRGIDVRDIVESSGTLSTITVTSSFSQALFPQADFIIAKPVDAKRFKIVNITCPEKNIVEVQAIAYDANKFARVEGGVVVPDLVYTDALNKQVGPPSDIVFAVESQVLPNGNPERKLRVTWTPPATQTIAGYDVIWNRNNENNQTFSVDSNIAYLPANEDGLFTVNVFSRGFNNIRSGTPAVGTYTLDTGLVVTLLNPVTDLVVLGTGGLVFSSDDLAVQWTNPLTNSFITDTALLNFDVHVLDGATVLRTATFPGVPAGETQTGTYTYQLNLDDGGPRRTLTIEVSARDAAGGVTEPTVATFTNPPPGIPLDIKVEPGIGGNKLSYTPPRDLDFEGVLVWASTNHDFELSPETLIYDGSDTSGTHTTTDVEWFYRFATYDSFAKDYTGATLNVTAVYSSKPTSVSLDFEKNKLPNSSFEGRQASARPTYWEAHTVGSAVIAYGGTGTWVAKAGRDSPNAFGATITSGSTSALGVKPNSTDGAAGVIGGWKPNVTYVLSFYAKKVAGAGMTTMGLSFITAPSLLVAASNPALDVEYKRYVFKLTWGETVEAGGFFKVTALGTFAVGDGLIIDDAQVEEGDSVTDYKPRIAEVTTIDAAAITGLISDIQIAAISATKLTGTVDEARIAGLAASKITGQLTNVQIAAIDAAKLVGTLTPAQIGIINAANLTGQITATQIADGAISTPKLQAGSILTAHIGAGQVTAGNIAAGAITATQLAANSVTSGNIVAGTILAGDIASQTITSTQIAAGTITGANIAAGSILASNIAAGAITTGKLLVTGEAKALNTDPYCKDLSAWIWGGSVTSQADSSVPIGTHSLRLGSSTSLYSLRFPIEANKTYKVACFAKQISGGGTGRFYLRANCFNASGSIVSYLVTGISPLGVFDNLTVPGVWTRFNGTIKPTVGAVMMEIYISANNSVTGVVDVTDVRVEETIGADLIVDGTIAASKLIAGSIIAANLQAGSVTNTAILGGTIDGSKLANATITNTQIAGGTITGANISGGTINTNNLVIGGVVTSATTQVINKKVMTSTGAQDTGTQIITGPTLQTIGRDVLVSFDGSISLDIATGAVPYVLNFLHYTELRLVNTVTAAVVPFGTYSFDIKSVLGYQFPWFRQIASGIMKAVPAGTWRLDVIMKVDNYTAEAVGYNGTTRGTRPFTIMNAYVYGKFAIAEFKV